MMLSELPYAIALLVASIAAWDIGRRLIRQRDLLPDELSRKLGEHERQTDLAIENMAKEMRRFSVQQDERFHQLEDELKTKMGLAKQTARAEPWRQRS